MKLSDTLEFLDKQVTRHPGRVVLVFLLATAIFASGLGEIQMEAGTDDFIEDSPEFQTLENVNEEFGPVFGGSSGSTQLIQRGENVLSKQGVLRMLRAQHRLERNAEIRVSEATSNARTVASAVDPDAETLEEQIRAVEQATESEVREAAREASETPGFGVTLGEDLNTREPHAGAAIGTVEHTMPWDGEDIEGGGGDNPLTPIQFQSSNIVESTGGDIIVFGGGILGEEFERVIEDSLVIVIPVVIALILLFLITAYRDPFDLVLALAALAMTMVWTFGFTGLAGIPFSQMMIAVPPLLLAIGIDFGIHAVNRYREERVAGQGIIEGMDAATDQLLVAFFIVTGTTVIGFGANMASELGPIADFGVAASVGIIFTFLIFGVFMPAAKIYLEQRRDDWGLPDFGTRPFGGSSRIGDVLALGGAIGKRAPVAALVVALVITVGAGAYATNVDTTFDDDDFLPPEELPAYVHVLPEGMQPEGYTVTSTINFLEDSFATSADDEVTLYLDGGMNRDYALQSLERAAEDPPENFVGDREAETRSILDVIDAHAAEDDEFAAMVARNDVTDDGVPDRNVEEILDALLASESREQALDYVTDDLQNGRVVYSTDSDALPGDVTDDAWKVADEHHLDATPTGQLVVFQAVADIIFESAIVALALALVLTALFLLVIYRVLEGRATLGLANLVPIVVAVTLLAGTMPVLGVPFNALTATTLSISIGVGVAYSVHITHRFIDEYEKGSNVHESVSTTLRGTGGALTMSMLTTLGGAGSLVLAITPILGQFGLLMSISVIYSYITAMVVLPPTLVVWEDRFG